ncbi:MAG: hypothetical protein KAX38_09160 [Candidatus Krumholzibacteria bacterium]|nr:hypothetical protein [Candidatus Krumholzibacteria bacterium]
MNIPFRALLSLVVGTAYLYLIILVFAIFRWNIYYIGILVPIISLVLISLRAVGVSRPLEKTVSDPLSMPPIPSRTGILLFIILALVSVMILKTGDPVGFASDSPDHIAYIRAISRSHEAFPVQFLYRDGGLLTRDIRKGLVHAMWGTVNSLTGRSDAYAVWSLISAIGSVFIILALFCAGILLFRSASIGLLSAILFVLCYHGGLKSHQLITIAYSFPFGKIYFVTFLSFVPYYLKSGKREYLFLLAASSLGATGSHITHFLISIFIIFVFSLVKLIRSSRSEKKRLWRKAIPILSLTTILLNSPYLLIRYLRDYAPNNEIHTHVQAVLSLNDKFLILNPLVFFRVAGPLWALAVISIFILWKRSRKDENLKLLIWGVIAIFAMVFNPILAPYLLDKLSYLLIRFEFAVPSMLMAAYLINELWKVTRGQKTSMSRRTAVLGWIAVILFIGYPLLKNPLNFAYSQKRFSASKKLGCLGLTDLYAAINKNVPEGSVIASDPITSYCIPAFTDQFVVCTYDQHSIPNDSTALDRILDCRNIYLPGTSVKDVVHTLKKYNGEYLVINGRIPTSLSPMYWKPDKRTAEAAAEKLASVPDIFQVIYIKDSLALLRLIDNTCLDSFDLEPLTPKHLGPRVTPEKAQQLMESGEPGIRIKDVRINREEVQRGDTLQLSIEWVAEGENMPRSYVTHIRFDTCFEKGPLYSASYGKIYRKIYERLKGRRFRFRADHLPLNGIYPPDLWPPLRIVKDSAVVIIPKDITPGIYSIAIKLSRKTQYPNYAIRDLLSDDDLYSGTVVGEVTIE